MSGGELQAKMYQLLQEVQALTNEALIPGLVVEQAAFRSALAQANATAALAIAVTLSGGDVEMALADLADKVRT